MGIGSLLEEVPSGQVRNCNYQMHSFFASDWLFQTLMQSQNKLSKPLDQIDFILELILVI